MGSLISKMKVRSRSTSGRERGRLSYQDGVTKIFSNLDSQFCNFSYFIMFCIIHTSYLHFFHFNWSSFFKYNFIIIVPCKPSLTFSRFYKCSAASTCTENDPNCFAATMFAKVKCATALNNEKRYLRYALLSAFSLEIGFM